MSRQESLLPAPILDAVRRFERWRSFRGPRERVPEPLWELTAKLAAEFGINRTARALRLDYVRVEQQTKARRELRPGACTASGGEDGVRRDPGREPSSANAAAARSPSKRETARSVASSSQRSSEGRSALFSRASRGTHRESGDASDARACRGRASRLSQGYRERDAVNELERSFRGPRARQGVVGEMYSYRLKLASARRASESGPGNRGLASRDHSRRRVDEGQVVEVRSWKSGRESQVGDFTGSRVTV